MRKKVITALLVFAFSGWAQAFDLSGMHRARPVTPAKVNALALLLPHSARFLLSSHGGSSAPGELALWRPPFLLLWPGLEPSCELDGYLQS